MGWVLTGGRTKEEACRTELTTFGRSEEWRTKMRNLPRVIPLSLRRLAWLLRSTNSAKRTALNVSFDGIKIVIRAFFQSNNFFSISPSTPRTTPMLPRQPRASTSKMPASRKRTNAAEAESSEEEFINPTLAFEEEEEEEETMAEEVESDGEDADPFPSVQFDDSDEGDFSQGDEEETDSGESLGLIDPEEEAALLAEIEAEDAEEDEDDEEIDPLTELIRRNTFKPNEEDGREAIYEDPELLKDFMRRSKVVVSDITGQEKTQWEEEIDAGYGSDSSTEEVSLSSFLRDWGADEDSRFFFGVDDESDWKCSRLLLRRFTAYWLQYRREESHATRAGR